MKLPSLRRRLYRALEARRVFFLRWQQEREDLQETLVHLGAFLVYAGALREALARGDQTEADRAIKALIDLVPQENP